MRAAIAAKLVKHGVSPDCLPRKFEYRVRQACHRAVFGDPERWYTDLREWLEKYRSADEMNKAEFEVDQEGRYHRSYVAPGVARRLLGELLSVRYRTFCDVRNHV